MNYKFEELKPENFHKCGNIWDMEKDPERTKNLYNQLLSKNIITFVCIEDDQYIGEAALVLKNNDPDYTIPGKRIYLSRMRVKPECRNRGIGGIIIDYLVDYAKSMGYTEMSLGVDIGNVGARWLYEKKGFTNIIFVGEDNVGKYVKLLKTL